MKYHTTETVHFMEYSFHRINLSLEFLIEGSITINISLPDGHHNQDYEIESSSLESYVIDDEGKEIHRFKINLPDLVLRQLVDSVYEEQILRAGVR